MGLTGAVAVPSEREAEQMDPSVHPERVPVPVGPMDMWGARRAALSRSYSHSPMTPKTMPSRAM